MRAWILRLMIVAVGLASASRAHAIGWNLRLEGGVALPVDRPRSGAFTAGGETALRPSFEFLRFMDVHLVFGYIGLSTKDGTGPAEKGLHVGAGLRFLMPRHSNGFLFPWLDIDGLFAYDIEGKTNHGGLSVGAGLMTPLNESHSLFIGPFLRYMHVFNSSPADDSKTMIVGVDIEYGSGRPVAAAPVSDRDGDGVPDDQDRCPDQPGPKENGGCPLPPPSEPDTDKDGIPDSKDKCPNEPGPPPTGCPVHDRDKDGVADEEDKCPDKPGPKEFQGCPDTDGDGVPDNEDNCPDKAGPKDNQGCPVYKSVKVTKEKLEIAQKVYFATGKSNILPKSFPLLDEVAQVLKENPSIKVRVEGHTDNVGKPEKNLKLSDDRANSVRDYLAKKGVAADRMTAKGFGDTVPVGDNKTPEGREQNRRVDFVVTSQPGATAQ